MRILALLLLGGWALTGVAAVPEVPEAEQARYQRLINELRCVVCQNQSIAESNAPLAQDLREIVAGKLREGRSDAEIYAFMTARYGDFVLYNPPIKPTTWLLWFGPFALLGAGLVVAVRHVRRAAHTAAATPPDPETLARLLDRHRSP
jgi:cytochrome c-type biogenesis protein CcmH